MFKNILTSELKRCFQKIIFEFGGEDDIIATIPPIHQSWEPIIICDDGVEVTVYYGDFTHEHYGYYGEESDPELVAQSVAIDVIETMKLVFDDQIEFFKFRGGGGYRRRGTQGKLSKILFGKNGVVWSGDVRD